MIKSLESTQTPVYLEHYADPGGPPRRVLVDRLPFSVGRSPSADLVLYSRQVSKKHSEIYSLRGVFRVRDLESANGTLVNGQRVKDTALADGDLIHVADVGLRFGHEPLAGPRLPDASVTERTPRMCTGSPTSVSKYLGEMLAERRAVAVFQPIVFLSSGRVMGYEALGRGNHPNLTASPAELFRLAGDSNLAVQLSAAFRSIAVPEAARLPRRAFIFMNLHPMELAEANFIESLESLRRAFPDDRQLVLELAEAAIPDPMILMAMREQFDKLCIGLAYDDFGAGASRLKEFADVRPDFVKFDMSLIRGIDRAAPRQNLMRALLRLSNDLGVGTIAEGIETEEEAAWCKNLGCQFGQGYLFGRPQPLGVLGQDREDTLPMPSAGPPLK